MASREEDGMNLHYRPTSWAGRIRELYGHDRQFRGKKLICTYSQPMSRRLPAQQFGVQVGIFHGHRRLLATAINKPRSSWVTSAPILCVELNDPKALLSWVHRRT